MSLKVLLGCEESDTVRQAFEKLGYDAWSCDIIPSRNPNNKNHIQDDILKHLDDGWDLAIFFTPCTFLCNSGVRWLETIPGRKVSMIHDARLFKKCLESKIPFSANENPIPHKYALNIIGRKYDQIIQPWQFGHTEKKSTCLWLKNLPKLIETDNVKIQMQKLPKNKQQRIHYMAPSENRQRDRSTTFSGIADAMAKQWSEYVINQMLVK